MLFYIKRHKNNGISCRSTDSWYCGNAIFLGSTAGFGFKLSLPILGYNNSIFDRGATSYSDANSFMGI